MKKFNEYNKFNLSDINKEVLKKWDARWSAPQPPRNTAITAI